PRPTPRSSRSSPAATSNPAPSSPATLAWPAGANASVTPCSPPPSSTVYCTAGSSSASTARPTGCVPTNNAPTNYATPSTPTVPSPGRHDHPQPQLRHLHRADHRHPTQPEPALLLTPLPRR